MTTVRQLYYAFPIRLLALHLRSHLVMVGLWVLLALFMTGVIGRFFGMNFLLLLPEYYGEVNFLSFFVTGLAFGAFCMIWHLVTYLLSADRFPFLATLQAPFTKFSLNNSVIPLCFLLTYLSATTWLQWHDELTSGWTIAGNLLGFLSGATVFIIGLAGYLHLTNKDIGSFLKHGNFTPLPGSRILAPGYRLPTLHEIHRGATRWRVDTYLSERLHVRPVRSVAHYNLEMLGKVFRQNHFNAALVQVIALLLLMALGLFMDYEWARIPTGATIFILCSIVMSIVGAVFFWFRHWSTLVFILLLVIVNFTTGLGFFNYRNRAYGLDYDPAKRPVYDYRFLQSAAGPAHTTTDKKATLKILNNWLLKNRAAGTERPKMVFLCVSGGGTRSALWTMQTLQQADKATNGRLLRQSMLISGASGGILGAGFLREIYLREQMGEEISVHDSVYIDDMGKDLLNPVSFAIVANDLFFPLSTFQSGNFRYRKDRGYLLERQLNENCRNMLGKRLSDYQRPEAEAIIPMMVMTPFIVNDARRLLISPQGVSYLMQPPDDGRYSLQPEVDAVDFRLLFAEQQADSLAFTTALRMNCTYPFILPNAWLPTRPAIEAMDAGFRDNYGVMTAARFIHVFRDWINANTSGVVLVQMRCWEKIEEIEKNDQKGIISNMFTPFSVATNLTAMQDYDQDNTLALIDDLLGKNRLQVFRFSYHPTKKENEASLSLHLSKREKRDIRESFYLPQNKANLSALQQALK